MKVSIVALALLACAGVAQAQTSMKAGLWETKMSKMVVDGNDMTAMINQLSQQGGNTGAHAPAAGMGSARRVCISPEMAAKHALGGGPHGECPPVKSDISGNKVNFAFNCTVQGNTVTGSGALVMNGDSMSYHIDSKVSGAHGDHTSVTDMQMTYIGSDCQGIKPMDQK